MPTREEMPDQVTGARSRTDAEGTKIRHPAEVGSQSDAGATSWRAPLTTDSHVDATTGTVLCDRYRLEELLGKGGMGLVFRATDLRMPGVRVAIKLLKPEFREQPQLLNMLQESVRKVRSLPHPNIASVYSLETDGHNDLVVMELLQGQTLKSLLDSEYARGLPIGMARILIGDLCAALAYAHDHGIIHSDIKPANIFITPSGRAKLFDFDIARVLRGPVGYFDARQVGAMTCAYASIEMEHGEKPDPRDDVYALACVIYEMLSGKHPFGGASASEAQERGLHVEALPALRRSENQALSRALKFARQERLESVEALRSAFRGDTVAKAALPLRPLPLVAAGVIVVLLVAALVWGFLRPTSTPQKQSVAAHAAAELDRAKSLSARATQLAVDEHDETLRQAESLLKSVRDGDNPERVLQQAQSASAAFVSALAHSPRVARVGTTEPQLQQALQLCRQVGFDAKRCSVQNLADESPRSVSLRPFAVDPNPVTNGDFARFVQATGRRTSAETEGVVYSPDTAHGWDDIVRGQNWRTLRAAAAARGELADSLPVLGVDLESARAYCNWKGERLPSEDEWEYSARGPSGRLFPWGDEPAPPTPLPQRVLPVGSAGTLASHDMGGNVAEWTETPIAGQRVLRGGSWLLPQPYFQRLALRRLAAPGAVLDAGFRCVMSVESWPGTV